MDTGLKNSLRLHSSCTSFTGGLGNIVNKIKKFKIKTKTKTDKFGLKTKTKT